MNNDIMLELGKRRRIIGALRGALTKFKQHRDYYKKKADAAQVEWEGFRQRVENQVRIIMDLKDQIRERNDKISAFSEEVGELKKIHVGIIDKANHLADIAQIRQFERDEKDKANAWLREFQEKQRMKINDLQREILEISKSHECLKDVIASMKEAREQRIAENNAMSAKIKALESRTLWDFIRQAFREKPSIVIPRAEFRATKDTQ